MPTDTECAVTDVDVATADWLLTSAQSPLIPVARYIGEGLLPTASPPGESVTHWDGRSR